MNRFCQSSSTFIKKSAERAWEAKHWIAGFSGAMFAVECYQLPKNNPIGFSTNLIGRTVSNTGMAVVIFSLPPVAAFSYLGLLAADFAINCSANYEKSKFVNGPSTITQYQIVDDKRVPLARYTRVTTSKSENEIKFDVDSRFERDIREAKARNPEN
jgi:hypothetical protein